MRPLYICTQLKKEKKNKTKKFGSPSSTIITLFGDFNLFTIWFCHKKQVIIIVARTIYKMNAKHGSECVSVSSITQRAGPCWKACALCWVWIRPMKFWNVWVHQNVNLSICDIVS